MIIDYVTNAGAARGLVQTKLLPVLKHHGAIELRDLQRAFDFLNKVEHLQAARVYHNGRCTHLLVKPPGEDVREAFLNEWDLAPALRPHVPRHL